MSVFGFDRALVYRRSGNGSSKFGELEWSTRPSVVDGRLALADRLQAFAEEQIKYRSDIRLRTWAGGLAFAPESKGSFSVSLHAVAGQYLVAFDECQETFDSWDDAARWAALALTSRCRLKVNYIGALKTAWTLEYFKGPEGWTVAFSSGHFQWNTSKFEMVSYLSNAPRVDAEARS